MPYYQYQLVLSWYIHQPVTSVKFQKGLGVSLFERLEPIDRTPGTPGSDKNGIVLLLLNLRVNISTFFILLQALYRRTVKTFKGGEGGLW